MRCSGCQHLNPDDAVTCRRCGQVVHTPRFDSTLPGPFQDGRYQVTAPLGAGAMGQVYRAEDRTIGRAVALKVLSPELWNDDRARTRMAREASALARVRHPNVVGIFDVFEERGALVLALELVPGGTLAERLRAGPPPLETAVSVLDAVLAGLTAIHQRGLVHRDLKPANVLLTSDGVPKIADLGIARDTLADSVTSTGALLGTIDYMSPEQVRGQKVSAASDVYAAGILACELITGQLPLRGTDEVAMLAAHLEHPPDLEPLRARAPASLVSVVARSLAKEPGGRFQNAAELRAAVSAAISYPTGVATPAGAALTTDTSRASPIRDRQARQAPTPSTGERLVDWVLHRGPQRSGWYLPIAIVLALALLAMGALVAAALIHAALQS